MAKNKPKGDIGEVNLIHDVEMGRGQVKDNALKAMVTSKLYRAKVEKAKKGKGCYQRNMKHKGKEPYSKAA
ncbi:ribosome alternative rescue factor ArfA [Vibrio europaeus]|uniref:Ribosome alternative rescue factor ArfA n=1 Tax=Vibrio europaeus TaxID=300876 RepID=A0A178J5T6_9VIBR|nr:alternative ribosome rescue factor ArfA [Vibrio europaeus]MDC5706144.1 alternative ribosome rescue factor ArfA [Vibrio europaeus]MDC5709554.1 ribosome alternative rescue factor ArfA [Vibrio europaeus]MDC5713953.1 ribosome alternative rescue factor ArfA [Vibrio europaeus]MDC5720724.1 ribosome alternative rescue factor ArfA [Vibrio europaeus]MDC5723438.1 ribosome alternative rescue factor ArfA [Vibrio europaeus]